MDGSHHRDLLNALEPAPSEQRIDERLIEAPKASRSKSSAEGPDGKLLGLWQTIRSDAQALDSGEGSRSDRDRQEASARLREKELKLARLTPRTATGVLAKIAFAKYLGGIGGEHMYAARNLRTIEAGLGRMAEAAESGGPVRSVRSKNTDFPEQDYTAETIGDANIFLKRVEHLGVCARSAWGMLQMTRGEIRDRYGADRKMLDYTSNLFVDGSKLAEQLSGIIETANLRLLSGAAPDTLARPSETDRRFLAEAESLFRKYVPAERFDPNACAAWCSNALAVAKQDRAAQQGRP
jgi:hypothetical protein